jgi:hypothetical protein
VAGRAATVAAGCLWLTLAAFLLLTAMVAPAVAVPAFLLLAPWAAPAAVLGSTLIALRPRRPLLRLSFALAALSSVLGVAAYAGSSVDFAFTNAVLAGTSAATAGLSLIALRQVAASTLPPDGSRRR